MQILGQGAYGRVKHPKILALQYVQTQLRSWIDMPMRPCSKCLENQWRYSLDDATRMVTATCKYCEHEVQFMGRKSKRPVLPNDPRCKPVDISDRYRPDPAFPERPDHATPWE